MKLGESRGVCDTERITNLYPNCLLLAMFSACPRGFLKDRAVSLPMLRGYHTQIVTKLVVVDLNFYPLKLKSRLCHGLYNTRTTLLFQTW